MKFYRKLGTVLFSICAPLIYFVLSKTKRVRVAIVVKDEVFMVKNWLGKNYWTLPGGGVRRGEMPKDAAVREVSEELGYTINKAKLLDITADDTKRTFFLLRLSAKPQFKLRKKELVDSRWLSFADIAKHQLSSEVNQVLATLINQPDLLK